MNTDLRRILKRMAKEICKENLKKKCNKVGNKHPKVHGSKEIRAIVGLSFNEAILFWGLTDSGSDEEPWSRVCLNNWFVYYEGTTTPLQVEIARRVRDSGHRDRKYDRQVKNYLLRLLFFKIGVPVILLPILIKKFNTIYS